MTIAIEERKVTAIRETLTLSLEEYFGESEVVVVPPRPPMCFLMAGKEAYFSECLQPFQKLLTEVGCEVVLRNTDIEREGSLELLRQFVRNADGFRPLLIAYYGHGSIHGWEGSWKNDNFRYSTLAEIVNPFDGPLFIINGACYGATFLPLLWNVRHPHKTGYLGVWNGNNVCCAENLFDELHEAWLQQKTPEMIRGEIEVHETDLGDYELPRYHRWGARFDQLFFRPEL